MLRPIEEADAALMLSLRQRPDLTEFLPPLDITLDEQRAWVRRQMTRPDDYMFAIQPLDRDTPIGFFAAYNPVGDGEMEWGRWVMSESSPVLLESVLLLHRFIFETLDMKRLFSHTAEGNIRVLTFHEIYGARRCGLHPAALQIGDRRHDMVEHEILRPDWDRIRQKYARFL